MGMPRLREASPAMPDAADRAWRAISGRARLDILRALLVDGPATARELAQSTGLSAPTIQTALTQLEALDYVSASEPVGLRKGKHVTYGVQRDDLEAGIASLHAYLGFDETQ